MKGKGEDAVLQRFLNSLGEATVLVNERLEVALYSDAAAAIFGTLRDGVPASALSASLEQTNIESMVQMVLADGQRREAEVRHMNGKYYRMLLLPYHGNGSGAEGVLMLFMDITSCKYTEKQRYGLQQSMEWIIESAKDYAIFTLDNERRVNTWNSGAELVFGYREHEIVGKSGDIFFVDEDRAAGAPEWEQRKAMEDGLAENERWHLRKDGTRFYGSGTVRPVYAEDGTPLGFVKIMRDLTDQKSAADALQESEAHLSAIFSKAQVGICEISMEGNFLRVNDTLCVALGRTREELLNSNVTDVTHPDDISVTLDAIQRLQTTWMPESVDKRYIRPDGSIIWANSMLSLLKTQGGRPVILAVTVDLTVRRNAEEALRHSEERLRITLESATDYAIITMDTAGIITSWSRGAELIFKYTENEAKGKHTELIFTEEDRKAGAAEAEMQQAATQGRAIDERWHVRKDGSTLFMSGVLAPLLYGPRLVGFVKVARDITDRKLLEEHKDEFIGIASHELKTPVTSIKVYTELLAERVEQQGDKPYAAVVNKLNVQVDRLTNLINDLLDTTSISAGRLQLNKQQLNINTLLAEQLEELQQLWGSHRLALQAGDVAEVAADRERVSQVVTNLIANAVKYSAANSDITVTTRSVTGGVQICIADQGIGIAEDAKHKVFDRFFRVDVAKREAFPGLGLGLYISAGIVKQHGGTISVESKPGAGSTFCFVLPTNGDHI